MNLKLLETELELDEGNKSKPYKCTAGKTTIGIGRNLDDVGLSPDEISYLFQNDIKRVIADLDKNLGWWRGLSDTRKRVLANMAFNLGIAGLLGFKNTLKAIAEGRYNDAADGMLASKWATQVGARAQRLAKMMREG
jgi:lysozyme